MQRCILLFLLGQWFLIEAQGQGPGRKRSPSPPNYISDTDYASAQMQSRAVDTRVQFEVLEGQPRGTAVGFIPIKPGFTYRFNEPPREFIMNSTTGEIRTSVVLDRESLATDRFDLVVLSSQPTYPIEVRIFVADVNDNPPEFPEPSISVSFSESAAAGTKLLLDTATDKDSGINSVSDDYRIVNGNTDGKFRLEVTANPSGETSYLYLQTTGKLDRETVDFYQLNISARDGGTPTRYGYLQVNVTILDVNDNPPIFAHSVSDYSVSLNESVLPGTKVLQVIATDNDQGDNAKITYYLSETERKFTVNPDTGEIFTSEKLECPQQNCQQQRPGGSCPKSCVFTVFARDHGSPRQDGRTYVTVNLLDANDHDPVIKFRYFPSTAGFATVDENAINGSVVAAVSVVDPDEGLNGETKVEIRSGNEMNHFRLESTQSFDIVRVNGLLDREHINKYNLTIIATDKGNPPRTATAFLIIHVNDVNDHEPVFEKSEYSAVLSELAPAGSYVAGITATDEDTGVNAQIFYAFVSGNEHQWFEINPTSGLITTKSKLDREKQDSIELKISARDGGPNPKWAYTQLKVSILDENDEKPQFTQNVLNISLLENSAANTLVATLTASDHDQGTNGSVTYSLHQDVNFLYPGIFSLDSITGQLTVKTKLDRETITDYELKVIAKDHGTPPQSSTATVFLFIEDVNDNNPVFYPSQYFKQIPEDTQVGVSIVQVSAYDLDCGKNAQVTYSIESGSEGLFHINDTTGILSLKASLINSNKELYRLKISAVDGGNRKATENAIVEIIKNSMVETLEFEHYNGYTFSILEDHDKMQENLGRDVGKIKIRNSDMQATIDQIKYAIVYGDPKKKFEINDRTGEIITAAKLDREEQSIYNLVVSARSRLSYGKTFVNITLLDLNDNAPIFNRDKDEITIPENAAVGQEIYVARARDRDSGVNSRIFYSLSSNPDDQFKIVETNGVIYLNKPIQSPPGSTLTIEIVASDSGKQSLSSKHSVNVYIQDVNDHTPVFDMSSYETSLLESTPVNNRFFELVAKDSDLGNNGFVSYSIIEGNGEDKFGIFPDGFMYVRNSLDRETRDYYALTVLAEDHGKYPRSSSVPVVIHIIDENDNKPEFSNSSFVFSVMENLPPDSFVGKLIATDKDVGRNAELSFALSNAKGDFEIDSRNGFIKTMRSFDRENLLQTTGQNFISLEATVSDNGSPRLKDKVKVDVYITDQNDNSPQFLRTPYKVQISEGASIGTQVFRVSTMDADEGLNGDVYYKIISGNDDEHFSIDEATGQITISKLLDRETVSKFNLKVLARDAATVVSNQLSSTTMVTIDVLDENDNAPMFVKTESKISVYENTTVNTQLFHFQATDSDIGVNNEVLFSIGSGNKRDTFHMDPVTGILYLHKKLDYEEINSYVLNVTASDGGTPRLSTIFMFTINVEDCNDNPPSFPNTAIVRQIRENIPINTPIVTVTAEDPDSGINGKILYAISKQEPENSQHPDKFHFHINPKTGVIHTLLPIDRESVDTFRLTVVATDQAIPESNRLFAEKLVTVIVEDTNDNAPQFVSMNAAILPQQKSYGAMQIMQIQAKDLDSGTNGLVTYELTSGNMDIFRLHRSTGVLNLKYFISDPLPRYQISVKATDEAVQSDRKSTDAYVTLISPGTSGPAFEENEYSGSVYENEPPGTSILTVKAEQQNAEIEYYVTNITTTAGKQVNRLFDIDTKLGIVTTAQILDREAGAEIYDVEVYAVVVNTESPQTSKTKKRRSVLSICGEWRPQINLGNSSERPLGSEPDLLVTGQVNRTDE
ncbi:hypothetical protein M8J76_011971 [Diaphorina citri]|nr:hypothetical protein M8J75_009387 [Diaphorina citri]KAI5745543.1 hypothetical protein M8J76_011971 [Diaphorina citri]